MTDPKLEPAPKPYPCSMARRFQRKVAKAQWRKEEIGVANLGHQTVIVSLGAIFSPSSFASLQLCAFALNPNCIVTVKP